MREGLTWIENEVCDQVVNDMNLYYQWQTTKASRLPRKRKKAFKKAMTAKMYLSYEFYQSDPL